MSQSTSVVIVINSKGTKTVIINGQFDLERAFYQVSSVLFGNPYKKFIVTRRTLPGCRSAFEASPYHETRLSQRLPNAPVFSFHHLAYYTVTRETAIDS
jgi:hypothetical protein